MSEPAVTPAPAPAPDFEAFVARENALAVGVDPTPEPAPAAEPEPKPAVEAAPDKSITPPKPDSRRTERRAQRDQDQINETIRRAVQDATEATERRLRAELGKPVEPAKPEPAAAKADEFQPTRPKPTDADFESYPEFVIALAEWVTDQRDAKRAFEAEKTQRAAAETSQREDFHARATTWIGRRDAFIAAHPAKSEALTDFLDTVHAGTPIGDVIMESEVGAEVADYLASNKTEADRIRGLGPIAALRALGKLEARFDPDTTTSASAIAAGPAAPKTVTSAPAPPTTLASRSATPADPTAAALARGDFEAFAEAENRKALAAGR